MTMASGDEGSWRYVKLPEKGFGAILPFILDGNMREVS
jgi:hypothetical protein